MNYPNQCYIELTNKCNLRCSHCFANGDSNNNDFLNLDDMKKIYNQIYNLGIVKVNISGGEPALHPDIINIMKFACSHPYLTSLLTNGILWNEAQIESLSKVVVNKERFTIQISLDGDFNVMKEQRLMVIEEYEKVIKNIKIFQKYGFYVTSLAVANSNTIDTVLKNSKYFLEKLDLAGSRIVPLFLSGRAVKNGLIIDDFWDKWSQLVVDITKLKKTNGWNGQEKKITLGYFNLYELVLPLDVAGMHDDIKEVWDLDVDDISIFKKQTQRSCFCEAGCSEIVISSKGILFPCVAAISTSLICGEMEKKSLAKIWNNSRVLNDFREFSERKIRKEPCVSCNYFEICNGGCRLTALEYYNDFGAPDIRCPIVRKYFSPN